MAAPQVWECCSASFRSQAIVQSFGRIPETSGRRTILSERLSSNTNSSVSLATRLWTSENA